MKKMPKSNSRIEAFKLVDEAIRLQLTDDGDLVEIEECLKKALKLNPDSIEALQEAAHFYDAVVPNSNKARKYAARCLAKVDEAATKMKGILSQ